MRPLDPTPGASTLSSVDDLERGHLMMNPLLRESSAKWAAIAMGCWVAGVVIAGVTGVDAGSCVALAMIGLVAMASKRVVTLASTLSAMAVAHAAWSAAGKPILVAPHYTHGGDNYGLVEDVAWLFVAFFFIMVAYAMAHLSIRRRPALSASAARLTAGVALFGLFVAGAVSVVRSSHAPAADEWIRAQPIVFDAAHHDRWIADPPSQTGEIRKHTVIEHGITVRATCTAGVECARRVVFPSGVEVSAWFLYRPDIIRHAAREGLWIVRDNVTTSEAAFDDGGREAGDIHLARVAGSVAPPRSQLFVLLVGLALSLRMFAVGRRRAEAAITGIGPYREAVERSPEDTAPMLQSAAIAVLAAAPMLGWWIALFT